MSAVYYYSLTVEIWLDVLHLQGKRYMLPWSLGLPTMPHMICDITYRISVSHTLIIMFNEIPMPTLGTSGRAVL